MSTDHKRNYARIATLIAATALLPSTTGVAAVAVPDVRAGVYEILFGSLAELVRDLQPSEGKRLIYVADCVYVNPWSVPPGFELKPWECIPPFP